MRPTEFVGALCAAATLVFLVADRLIGRGRAIEQFATLKSAVEDLRDVVSTTFEAIKTDVLHIRETQIRHDERLMSLERKHQRNEDHTV